MHHENNVGMCLAPLQSLLRVDQLSLPKYGICAWRDEGHGPFWPKMHVAFCVTDELLVPTIGSSLPEHDEMQIPYLYMSQANMSEAEPQEQAIGNYSVETTEKISVYALGKFLE